MVCWWGWLILDPTLMLETKPFCSKIEDSNSGCWNQDSNSAPRTTLQKFQILFMLSCCFRGQIFFCNHTIQMQGVKLKKSPLAANNSVYIYLYIPFATSTINLLGLLHPMGNDSHRGESVSLNLPLYLSIYLYIYIKMPRPTDLAQIQTPLRLLLCLA